MSIDSIQSPIFTTSVQIESSSTSLSDKFSSKVIWIRRFEIYTFLFINYLIILEIRHRRVMSLRAIEDKGAVVVVASYHSVSRNTVRFKALVKTHPRLSMTVLLNILLEITNQSWVSRSFNIFSI